MSNSPYSKALELLFQRPLEPIFTSRDNGKTAFDLPESFYTERYSGIGVELQSRYWDSIDLKIPLLEISKPNLTLAQKLGKKQHFSLFNNEHRKIAGDLIQKFLDANNIQTFASLAAYTRDRVNPLLFHYCYSVAVQHRKDTAHISVPPIAEQFPNNFVEPSVIQDAREEASLITNPGNRMRIEIPRNFTASEREEEQRLAYFREDIGINMHHWHWHLVYPFQGPRQVVAKNRRGELFYYMHHQIIARYNVERLCNNLAKVKPLNNLREPIPEAYFPKIISSLNNRTYPARNANLKLNDLTREGSEAQVAECQLWTDRILTAIDQGFVIDTNGKQYQLDETRGIDILGDIIEASSISVNSSFYGNLHNTGHSLLAFIHDPDGRHLEDIGVMGDVTTAMRDPVFYRWHSNIDNIFNKHKALLEPYGQEHLNFSGIKVNNVQVQISSRNSKPNILLTYWQKPDVDLAAALDFGPNGNVYASFTHIQHAPFVYTLGVNNNSGSLRRGTCRIFICPKVNERGVPLRLEEQRLLAIELDKFTVDLNPGQNKIRRRSDESNLTIPFERTFRPIGRQSKPTGGDALAKFNFCGCGWPQHMLLPKGKSQGIKMDLFVMISDFNGDTVQQTTNSAVICGDASSFCGLKDKLYPDKRTMGFPFDRRLPATDLDELTFIYSNMAKTDVAIIFSDRIIQKN